MGDKTGFPRLGHIYKKSEEETKAEPNLNPNDKTTFHIPNARGNLLDASPKVECSGQPTRRVP